MLEILSLVACGWLMMVNPTTNPKHPISQWEHRESYDAASECENELTRQWKKGDKYQRELVVEGRKRCIPADVVYPHTQPKK